MFRTTLIVVALGAIATSSANLASAQGAATPARVTGEAKLRAEAKISEATARATALKEVPAGKIQSGELELEDGKLIYSFDIKLAGKSGIEEVHVDAMTGMLTAHEHESPAAEKKEALQKANEKKRLSKP